jgi:hypothetical protein
MSFRGELREFELPDILQLIASQQKAGWLKVIWKGNCQFVFFRDGKITSTKNPADETDPLETFILRRRYLTEDQADRVAAIRRKTGMDFQDILQKEGMLSREEIQEIFDAMVEQAIFELMSIRHGQYEFETEESPEVLPEGALVADIGPILMEGARKADEVNEMRRFLGPEGGVLALTPAGRTPDSPSAEETALLALVNGVRSIDGILEDSGLDRYTATRGLFGAARKGWVKLLRSAREAATEPEQTAAFDLVRALRWAVPLAVLLGASLLFTGQGTRLHAEDPVVGEWRSRSARLHHASLEHGVRAAVEVYRVRHGSYPQSLEALVEDGLLAGEAAGRPGLERWAYFPADDGSGYSLALR